MKRGYRKAASDRVIVLWRCTCLQVQRSARLPLPEDAEDFDTKVKRHRQVMQTDADEDVGRKISRCVRCNELHESIRVLLCVSIVQEIIYAQHALQIYVQRIQRQHGREHEGQQPVASKK